MTAVSIMTVVVGAILGACALGVLILFWLDIVRGKWD